MNKREIPFPHPGQILQKEFLTPFNISACKLAMETRVPQIRIDEIIAGTRPITVAMGLRLSRYFELNDGFWTGLQLDFESAKAKDFLRDELAKIRPLQTA